MSPKNRMRSSGPTLSVAPMAYEIRPMRRDDIPPAFALIHQVYPCLVLTEDLLFQRFDQPLTYYRDQRFVAVEDGAVVGHVLARLYTDDEGTSHGRTYMAAVTPGHLDGDLPRDLLRVAEKHLIDHGADTLRAYAAQEGVQVGGEHFRKAILDQGYELSESAQILGLELAGLPPSPPVPEGVELRTLGEFEDDPRPIYELDRLTSQDEPGEGEDGFLPYPEWVRIAWNNPLSDRDISLALLMDGLPVAISLYVSDGAGRMESGMTGTLREYRNRGLAGYTKAKALELARAKGITHAYTGNHADNKPMLTINDRFGYTVVGSEETYLKA